MVEVLQLSSCLWFQQYFMLKKYEYQYGNHKFPSWYGRFPTLKISLTDPIRMDLNNTLQTIIIRNCMNQVGFEQQQQVRVISYNYNRRANYYYKAIDKRMKLTCSDKSNRKEKSKREDKFVGQFIDMSKINTRKSLFDFFTSLHICKPSPQSSKRQYSQPSQPSSTNSPPTLFPQLPTFSPSLYHSYTIPYSFAQYIHSQCINRLPSICLNTQQTTLFIVEVIERYCYEMEYTHEVGCVLAHLAGLEGGDEMVAEMVGRFPQVMMGRRLTVDEGLRERKGFLVEYAMRCVSMHMGHVYSEFQSMKLTDSLLSKTTNRWLLLIRKIFQSLLFQFIPRQLTLCLIKLYLTPIQSQQINDLYHCIHPYDNFIKLLISLFHYCHFMKKPKNVDAYYLLCSSPYMEVVEWPIVISNAGQFDLLVPKKKVMKKHGFSLDEKIKNAEIIE